MEERILESAEALANMMTDNGIARCSKAAISSTDLAPHEYKQVECETCGDDLPLFRMKKGLILCTPCQSAKENAKRR